MTDTLHSGLMPEQARVINVLNMFENGDMGPPDQDPKTMRVLPLLCKTVLDIRRLNKKLLSIVKDRTWKQLDIEHSWPAQGDEILVRFDDAAGTHVELMEWTAEDEEFYDDLGGEVYWMRLPRIGE